jgi:uncharacterized protein
MKYALRWGLLASLMVVLAGSVWADSPAVQDEAELFTPEVRRKAAEELAALKALFNVDLRIETAKSVPPAKAQEIKNMSAEARSRYFVEWARARAGKTDGLFILICKSPGHLQVEPGKETQKKAFTLEDTAALRNVMLAQFKTQKFDDGLRAGVRQIREALFRNLPPSGRPLARGSVKDFAGFFSPAAVEKANTALQAIPRQSGKEIAIETFPTPPPDQIKRVEGLSASERARFFTVWAEQRAAKSNLDGVLILICKKPSHLRVDVHGSAARNFLSKDDVGKLRSELLSRFGNREYDQGLADAVSLLRTKLAPAPVVAAKPPALPPIVTPQPVNASKPPAPPVTPQPAVKAVAPAPTPPVVSADKAVSKPPVQATPTPAVTAPPSSSAAAAKQEDSMLVRAKEKVTEVGQTKIETWKWVVGIVVGLLALWILIGILRALFGRKQPYPPPVRPVSTAVSAPTPTPAPSPAPNYPPGGYAPAPPRPYQGSGYQQGGGYQQPPAYPAAPPPGAPQRGGGGFVSGMLGGMFGAAAGNWIYDSFRGRGGSAPAAPPYTPPATSYRPAPSLPQNSPASNDPGYNQGGDFDSPDSSAAARGGDFDAAPEATSDAGGGGEFGRPADSDLGGGGEFGAPASADAGGGGDFGSPAVADVGGGGDFGSQPEPPADDYARNDSGGDFGGGGSFDNAPAPDQGGGGDFGADTASDDSGGNQGGDFA